MSRVANFRVWQQFIVICVLIIVINCIKRHTSKTTHYPYGARARTVRSFTRKTCLQLDNTLRARHKSCFLRPDTGPCRADILQYYFDVKQRKCYQFFWGGCQGNGNRFETKKECLDYCYLDLKNPPFEIPYFCSLAFDYGTCFGYYNRWGWDTFGKTCKQRLYSGCGGNQNNFETKEECLATCLNPPNNTLYRSHLFTTCVPFDLPELQN